MSISSLAKAEMIMAICNWIANDHPAFVDLEISPDEMVPMDRLPWTAQLIIYSAFIRSGKMYTKIHSGILTEIVCISRTRKAISDW